MNGETKRSVCRGEPSEAEATPGHASYPAPSITGTFIANSRAGQHASIIRAN